MAVAAGRAAILAKNNVPIAGVKSVTITATGNPLDMSSRDSAGFVALVSGTYDGRQITLEVEGVETDSVLRDIALNPAGSLTITDLTFKHGDALTAVDTISGTFFMSSYSETNAYDGVSEFKASFVSSGAWTRA